MSGPFDEALAKSPGPEPTAPTVSMNVMRLRDGGFIAGDVTTGATFACDDIGRVLEYIGRTLVPHTGEMAPSDILRALHKANRAKMDAHNEQRAKTFVCGYGCANMCDSCKMALK